MTIQITPNNPQYRIVEIFESLQGEGWNTGMPAVFIRLGKCNLACNWCDTDYLKFGIDEPFRYFRPSENLHGAQHHHYRRRTHHTNRIWITCLMHSKPKAYFLCIETNGLNPAPPQIDYVATSPKACYAAKYEKSCIEKQTKCALSPTAKSLRFVRKWNAKSAPDITISRLANKTAR